MPDRAVLFVDGNNRYHSLRAAGVRQRGAQVERHISSRCRTAGRCVLIPTRVAAVRVVRPASDILRNVGFCASDRRGNIARHERLTTAVRALPLGSPAERFGIRVMAPRVFLLEIEGQGS